MRATLELWDGWFAQAQPPVSAQCSHRTSVRLQPVSH